METLPSTPLPVVAGHRGWRFAQRAAVVALAVVGVLVVVAPDPVLDLFWSGVVPLLPVLFLVHPGLWRNVCPLATLGMGPEREDASPAVDSAARACALLLLLIPLRPLGLDGSALASAGLLVAATAGALAGRRRPRKAGFCNSWCPILPVERLYGQRPLIQLSNPRCPSCTVCTPRGCLDLSPDAASAQLLGPGRRGWRWLLTPLGAFAAAFPGVVTTFFLLPAEPGALEAYGRILAGGAVSWVVLSAAIRVSGASWRTAFPALGALAAGPYLWFALPGVAQAWGLGVSPPLAGSLGVLLVAGWWVHAWRTRAVRIPRLPAERPSEA